MSTTCQSLFSENKKIRAVINQSPLEKRKRSSGLWSNHKDLGGLQSMRNLARHMAFMIQAIADAKEKYGLPETEHNSFTSFPDGK